MSAAVLGQTSAPLLGPGATRIGAVLFAGLAAVLVAERRGVGDLPGRTLLRRWASWAAVAPLLALAVASSWGALAAVTALALQAGREYAGLVRLPRGWRHGLCAAAVVACAAAACSPLAWLVLLPALLLAASAVPLVRQDPGGLRDLAAAALGFAWVPWLAGCLLVLRLHVPGGAGILLALVVAVAASDVGAFVAGRGLGGAALAARISPAKTRAGVAGNLAGAAAGVALMGFALAGLPAPVAIGLPVVVAAGCVWGDLLESLVKRHAGVKDAGGWLPGFGGLLDRADSLLVAAPLATGWVLAWA
ncbi:MAG TPA: phosphatidate cytidylyltransferase [Egibacteraceae bacterium]|nr:phosphatidate cytidylyltransferase [Egibacteraceae bacterium]